MYYLEVMLKPRPQSSRKVDSVRPLRQPHITKPVFVYKKAAPTRPVAATTRRRLPIWTIFAVSAIGFIALVVHFAPAKTIERVGQSVAALVPNLPITGSKDNHEDMQAMQTAVAAVITANPDLKIGVSVVDIKYGTKATVGSSESFVGASTTKVLTAVVFLDQVEKGKESLSKVVNGYPLSWHLQQMINQSNNDSWVILNEEVGYSQLAAYAKAKGLTAYSYTDNSISAADDALLLQELYAEQLVNSDHTKLLLSYMQNTNNEDMIPAAVNPAITTYHKYGQLDGYLHDTGILVSNGHAVSVAVYTSAADGSNYAGRVEAVQQIVKAITANLYTQ